MDLEPSSVGCISLPRSFFPSYPLLFLLLLPLHSIPCGRKREWRGSLNKIQSSTSSPTGCTEARLRQHLCIMAWRTGFSSDPCKPPLQNLGTCCSSAWNMLSPLYLHDWLVPSPPQVSVQMLASPWGLLYPPGSARLCYVTSMGQISGA